MDHDMMFMEEDLEYFDPSMLDGSDDALLELPRLTFFFMGLYIFAADIQRGDQACA